MHNPGTDWQSAQADAAQKLGVRRAYLEYQLAAVSAQRAAKERELQRLSILDQSRQQLIQDAPGIGYNRVSNAGVDERGSGSGALSLAAKTAYTAALRGPDPIERALALLERAQAAAAHQRTQAAASYAIEYRRKSAAEQYEHLRTTGEQRVEEARQELGVAQGELRRTASALAEAQKVLTSRSTRLNDARSKLSTLMSTTRDLLRLVRPVGEMQSASAGAEEQATRELSQALNYEASGDYFRERGSPIVQHEGLQQSPVRSSSYIEHEVVRASAYSHKGEHRPGHDENAASGQPSDNAPDREQLQPARSPRATSPQAAPVQGSPADTPTRRLEASIRSRMRDLDGFLQDEYGYGYDVSPGRASHDRGITSPVIEVPTGTHSFDGYLYLPVTVEGGSGSGSGSGSGIVGGEDASLGREQGDSSAYGANASPVVAERRQTVHAPAHVVDATGAGPVIPAAVSGIADVEERLARFYELLQ